MSVLVQVTEVPKDGTYQGRFWDTKIFHGYDRHNVDDVIKRAKDYYALIGHPSVHVVNVWNMELIHENSDWMVLNTERYQGDYHKKQKQQDKERHPELRD